MKSTLLFLAENIGSYVPLMAFVAAIPFTGLFLADDKFKKHILPLIVSIITTVLCSVSAYAIHTGTQLSPYDSMLVTMCSIAAIISVISACGLIMVRTDNAYVFEFIVDYYVVDTLTGLLPSKKKVAINAAIIKQWMTWDKQDSTSISASDYSSQFKEVEVETKEQVEELVS